MSQEQVDAFLADLRAAFTALEEFRMPTIAAIDGPALGGGLELALSVDLRVAGADVTKIGLPETKLGIIPGAGGTQRAARLLGPAKAKDLIFTGRMMNAHEAHAFGAYKIFTTCWYTDWGSAGLGLVDYVAHPPSTAFDRALELAEQISTGGACYN
jgi:methylglutaconyl-CoA hydratase